jgi:uncharacterized C2H2 Zn-finger protein
MSVSQEDVEQNMFLCKICSRFFKLKSAFKRHTTQIHVQSVLEECPICKKSVRGKGNLKRHINAMHKNLQECRCPICSKVLKKKEWLQRHIQLLHCEDLENFAKKYGIVNDPLLLEDDANAMVYTAINQILTNIRGEIPIDC